MLSDKPNKLYMRKTIFAWTNVIYCYGCGYGWGSGGWGNDGGGEGGGEGGWE